MLYWLQVLLSVCAVVAWLSAVVHAVMLRSHRNREYESTPMLSGWRYFDVDAWLPSGHAIHHRFLLSIAAFFLTLPLMGAVGMLRKL